MNHTTAPSSNEFKYAFLMYHPTPDWGESGRFAVAVLGFQEQDRSPAKLCVLKNRLEAVKEFGGEQHELAIRGIPIMPAESPL